MDSEFLDLAYVINRHQIRHIDVLSNAPADAKTHKKESRYRELYDGLRDGKWKTDAGIAKHFGFKEKSRQYNRFKQEFKERAYNTVLFLKLEGPEFNDYVTVAHELLKDLTIIDTLIRRGASHSARALAKRAVEQGLKYEYMNIIVPISRMMREMTFIYPNLAQEYEYYTEIFEKYWPAYVAETEAAGILIKLMHNFINQKGYKKSLVPLAEEAIAKLAPLSNQNPYLTFQRHYHLIRLYAKTLAHDWQGGLQVAEEMLAFLKSKPFRPTITEAIFLNQKIGCLIMLHRHSEASVATEEAISLNKGAAWFSSLFKTHELGVVNNLYGANYGAAWQTLVTVTKSDRFNTIPQQDQETWQLFKGYLSLAYKAGTFELPDDLRQEAVSFRLTKWLNELPLHSKDKRGGNIPILLLQCLFLLLEKKYDDFEFRLEALRKYRQRNLEPGEEHFRTDCYVRMLELLPKYSYQPSDIQQPGDELLALLRSVPNDILDRSFELEVLPYERQWAWSIAFLRGETISGYRA